MQNRGQLIFGAGLLIIGLILLVSNLFNINLWVFCWPTLLIGLGVYLIFRPQLSGPDNQVNLRPLGDIRRYGDWEVHDEEIWMFVGDVRLDFSRAVLPAGETRIRVYGFVGSVELMATPEVGLAVSSTSFVTDAEVWGQKRDAFLSPVNFQTPGYLEAERKVRVETIFFVADLDILQV